MRLLNVLSVILLVLSVAGCGKDSTTSQSPSVLSTPHNHQSVSVQPVHAIKTKIITPVKNLSLLDDFNAIKINDTLPNVLHLLGRKPNQTTDEPSINVTDLEYLDSDHNKLEIGIEGKTVYMMGYIPKAGPDLAKPPLTDSGQQTAEKPTSSGANSTASTLFKEDYDAINIGDSQSSISQTLGRAPDWTYQATDGTGGTVLCYKDSKTAAFNELRIGVRSGSVYRVSYFPESDPVGSAQTKGDQ